MYSEKPCVALVFNLLQDVNILWPIANLVHDETSYQLVLLISEKFREKDQSGRWMEELTTLQAATMAQMHVFSSALSAHEILHRRHGAMIGASESNLNPHRITHELFRGAPAGFVKITIQHGFECAGFHQNREQTIAFGDSVHFAADVLCSWSGVDKLTHTLRSEIGKIVVTGPPSQILAARRGNEPVVPTSTGLICENLHSVRMSAAGDLKHSYMETMLMFSTVMAHKRRGVALRPHPGGQYVIRNSVPLPAHMTLQNDPIYRLDLGQYAYGISAPSSVLIDMVLAGIPTAVWQDPDGVIDADSYAGLSTVSSLRDWIAFANDAIEHRSSILEKQQAFLEESGLVVDPATVRQRYLDLIRSACGHGAASLPRARSKRVMFVANNQIPTLEICFFRPLAPLFEDGLIDPLLIVESQIARAMGPDSSATSGQEWLTKRIEEHDPDLVVFCRYSGPLADFMVTALHERNVPVIFHVDDDMMNVPIEIGEAKFREHNSPDRLMSVSTLLADADLVYCSTPRLLSRIEELGYENVLRTGPAHCSGEVYRCAVERPVRTIGYMGFDHAHDLEMILPDLVRFLNDQPTVRFELFGTIPIPDALLEFEDRVSMVLPVRPYQAFLDALVALDWDIGIAPLEDTRFNYYKANNKWVEYTSAGYAVVATAGMSYDECCAEDCGILVDGATGWYDALTALCDDPGMRVRLVSNAQKRLARDYSNDALRRQVVGIFDEAVALRTSAPVLASKSELKE